MFPEREQLYPLVFNEQKSSGRSSGALNGRTTQILAASPSFRWLIRLAGWADATNDSGERCYILILMLPKYDRHSKSPVLSTWGEGRASRRARLF